MVDRPPPVAEYSCAFLSKSKSYPSYKCLELVNEQGQLCILHSPDPNKDLEPFRKMIQGRQMAVKSDFRGAVFPEDAEFSGTFEYADFSEATFLGRVEFHAPMTFDGPPGSARTKFRGLTSFRGATFRRTVQFSSVLFADGADFSGAKWEREATFSQVEFLQGADFSRTRFMGDVRFYQSQFRFGGFLGTAANFQGARFAGRVHFSTDWVAGRWDFREAWFESLLILHRNFWLAPVPARVGKKPQSAERRKELVPKANEGSERAQASDAPEAGVEPPSGIGQLMSNVPPEIYFEGVLLDRPEQVRFEYMDLRRTTFSETNVRRIEFRNVRWPRTVWFARLRRKGNVHRRSKDGSDVLLFGGDGVWQRAVEFFGHVTTADQWKIEADLALFASPEKQIEKDRREAFRRVCRDLKANLEGQRDYADAGDFYYAEMELRRRQVEPVRRFLYWIYWLACGYGEKPLRALVLLLCIWLGVAVGFTRTWFTVAENVAWRTAEYQTKQSFRPAFSEALGHAARSLALQQRGSYLAAYTPGAHHVTLVANLFGPVQFGLFLLAMRRRFRR